MAGGEEDGSALDLTNRVLRHDVAMADITVSLDDDLMGELAQMARDEHTTEADLVREGVERLIHSRLTGPDIPLFARRLGPLAFPESHVDP
jgi:Ribbon-helix-helix protein, copG family